MKINPVIPIQFSHATGFPAASYTYFFQQLAPHPVSSVPIFGQGTHQAGNSWKDLLPQLIEDIERNHSEPVIGIGHSFGAALTFWAAKKRPDLFKKIILIDPPFMSRKRRLLIGLTSLLGITDKIVPIAKNAKKRRADFGDLAEARDYLKPKFLFRDFHPSCFEDYIQHGFVQADKGVTLKIPRDLEAKFFSTTPYILGSGKLSIPSYYLYPLKNGVLSGKALEQHKKRFVDTQFIPFEKGGHMFPMEFPHDTADFIKELIARPEGLFESTNVLS